MARKKKSRKSKIGAAAKKEPNPKQRLGPSKTSERNLPEQALPPFGIREARKVRGHSGVQSPNNMTPPFMTLTASTDDYHPVTPMLPSESFMLRLRQESQMRTTLNLQLADLIARCDWIEGAYLHFQASCSTAPGTSPSDVIQRLLKFCDIKLGPLSPTIGGAAHSAPDRMFGTVRGLQAALAVMQDINDLVLIRSTARRSILF